MLLRGLQLAAHWLLRSFPLLQAWSVTPAPRQPSSWFLQGVKGNADAVPTSVALLHGLTLLTEMQLPAGVALMPAEIRASFPWRCV